MSPGFRRLWPAAAGTATATVVATATAALLVAGCTGIADLHIPTPPPSPSPAVGATTTVTSDLTAVTLTPVGSTPPTTVVLTPGGASLAGIVTGPTGPVGGATVLVERLVGDSIGAKAVSAQPDGSWRLGGIRGGRYRVRAWHSPDLTLMTPQILLLGAKDNQSVNLTLMAYNGQSLSAALVPSPPFVGQPSTLVIQATQQVVGGDGVVRGGALAGASIFAVAAGNVVLAGNNPGTTDASGRLALLMGCVSGGPVGLSASLNGLTTFPLSVADCGVPLAPPATTVKPPTSSVP
ncbi:MAG: hypothetical protein M3083_17085 [Actinomycetota bacterium]|nr:hypothetical protein [Actinomycetota bacterium]MDQ6948395.1 hypothetical protein [Actinomycetota bacterium]